MTGPGKCLLALTVLLSCSCTVEIGDQWMAWLVGDWVANDGAITEHWLAVSPNTLEGRGVTTSNGKVSNETMRLVRMSGEVFFIAKVAHNDYPVAFRLADESTADRLIFSNPTHDFPKQITYRRDGPGKMTVIVSDGGSKGFELHFEKR